MPEHGPILKDIFHCRYFKINTVSDSVTVELCGALKVRNVHNSFCSLGLHFFDNILFQLTNFTVHYAL